jgi:hypothetical protein
MQCTGQRRCGFVSCCLPGAGLVICMNDSNGLLFGEGWLGAKEMCSAGCQSWVPMRIAKLGRLRRLLITGAIVRPPSTAREPFYIVLLDVIQGLSRKDVPADKSPLACPPRSMRGRMRIHSVQP